jgi:hypothetical protein
MTESPPKDRLRGPRGDAAQVSALALRHRNTGPLPGQTAYHARVSRARLELALAQIPPAAWDDFEKFASEFLIADFPDLRTMARPAGDKGRDADVFDVDNAGAHQVAVLGDGWLAFKDTGDR